LAEQPLQTGRMQARTSEEHEREEKPMGIDDLTAL
jgi:hypothetical protein